MMFRLFITFCFVLLALHPCNTFGQPIAPPTYSSTLETLAEKGDTSSQLALAGMYRDGRGVKQDYSVAAKWYQKIIDGKISNNALGAAQIELGKFYESGLGVQQDYRKASDLYLGAISSSDDYQKMEPQYLLGHLYEEGLGVKQDHEKAISLYLDAAKSCGDTSRKAMEALGRLYLKGGENFPPNYQEAYFWLRHSNNTLVDDAERHLTFAQMIELDKRPLPGDVKCLSVLP